jgi:ADP-ribose pyrophosphatase YjhB (NUDIX family)
MRDPMDVVRALYRALNAGDPDAVSALYHSDCRLEHVFAGADECGGLDDVRAQWTREFARGRGALPGGARVHVTRIGGIETGWGWVRAEWVSSVRATGRDADAHASGYSHFWIEDGRIRRHRDVRRELAGPPPPGAEAPASERRYPSRPIAGVGAVIVTTDRHVVLVKRTREPLAGQWSLPGGTLELGETLEAGTAREVLEETGLIVDVGPVVEVFDRILVDDDNRVRYHFVLIDYLCRPVGGALAGGSDVADAIAVAPAELDRYLIADKARDVIARAMMMATSWPISPATPPGPS